MDISYFKAVKSIERKQHSFTNDYNLFRFILLLLSIKPISQIAKRIYWLHCCFNIHTCYYILENGAVLFYASRQKRFLYVCCAFPLHYTLF